MATPTSLRELKKQQTRERIVDSAIRMFREKGFDATRVREICDEVQISEATFFNYFPTKEAVLHEYSLTASDLFGALLQHELAFPERPVGERVREIVRTVGGAFAGDPELMSVVITRSNLFYGSSGAKADQDMRNYDRFAELFRQGQDSGEIRSDVGPYQLAEIINATMMMTITNWLTGWWPQARAVELETRLMRAVDVFLDGCAPSSRGRAHQ